MFWRAWASPPERRGGPGRCGVRAGRSNGETCPDRAECEVRGRSNGEKCPDRAEGEVLSGAQGRSGMFLARLSWFGGETCPDLSESQGPPGAEGRSGTFQCVRGSV